MDSLAAVSPATNLILKINAAIVNPLIILMFAFALVSFMWGVRGYITGADNPEVRLKGSQQIMWGVIGMALMIMAFAIEKIVVRTFIGNDPKTFENIDKVLKPIN